MTQVVIQKQIPNQTFVLAGTEAKNPVPSRTIPNWEEIRGLSWIFYKDE